MIRLVTRAGWFWEALFWLALIVLARVLFS
jgi:hypothetical protein